MATIREPMWCTSYMGRLGSPFYHESLLGKPRVAILSKPNVSPREIAACTT